MGSDQSLRIASAVSNPNIAFIKYWGNRDNNLNLPTNGSISMNLAGLSTQTRVTFDPSLVCDTLSINGEVYEGAAWQRVSTFLDHIRRTADITHYAAVESQNNFPAGAGLASSASAFAALSLAASRAAGLELDEASLSRLARLGSGSASRSIPGGFVEWFSGEDASDEDRASYAVSIAPTAHWDLIDCVAVLSAGHKETVSRVGHALASTSPLQKARISGAGQRLEVCRNALLQRDFDALAAVAELDSNLMHAVMMTSSPPLFYWQPASLAVMQQIMKWRAGGIPVFYTIDAGPNVHAICLSSWKDRIADGLREISGVMDVLAAPPGGPTHLAEGNP
jgi:diphosphomevalonate decarboxylase